MKLVSLFFFFFISFAVFSQSKFSKEISLVTDNDLYTSIKNDRYYTSGIFISYRYLAQNKNENLEKKIIEWQIGHKMYSPSKATVKTILEHDRPFAAYLYGSFGINKVYKNNSNLKTSVQIGIIGQSAFGKELQDFIHEIYGFEKAIGWKHQIKNAFGISLQADYTKTLTTNQSNSIDISWVSIAEMGTVYTNLASGFYTRFGIKPLQKLANSIAFNTNLNNKNTSFVREAEAFFYVQPLLRYTFYDATLQGSFLNTASDVTVKLVPLVLDIELGFKFTTNRFNFGYAYCYNTNTSKNLRFNKGQNYGKITLNYLLF